MSQGTVAQLMSVGPQDEYLTDAGRSQFESRTIRHTRFATETIEDAFAPTFAFGTLNACPIPRRGDLMGAMYLRIVLPALGVEGTWAEKIGWVLMRRVRLKIGCVTVHDHERLWYDVRSTLFTPRGARDGLDRMIGAEPLPTTREHELFVPLGFFNCDRAQFLPACRVNEDIIVEVEAETLENCVSVSAPLPPGVAPVCSILTEHVFLSDVERVSFMGETQQVLVDVVQDLDGLDYKAGFGTDVFRSRDIAVDMRELNLPTRYLCFVAYDEVYDRYFDYKDVFERIQLNVNSREVFEARGSGYYSLVQTYDQGLVSDTSNVGLFSFGLDASTWHPSGSLNFARVQHPVLRIRLTGADDAFTKVKVFAVGINALVFNNGGCSWRYEV